MNPQAPLDVRDVGVVPVMVPLRWPIRTASGTISDAPLILIDLQTEEGVTGRSYLFGYQKLTLEPLADLVLTMGEMINRDPMAPLELNRKIRGRLTLLGTRTLIGMALSGLDMAAWDALGVATGQPLVTLLGGTPKPARLSGQWHRRHPCGRGPRYGVQARRRGPACDQDSARAGRVYRRSCRGAGRPAKYSGSRHADG